MNAAASNVPSFTPAIIARPSPSKVRNFRSSKVRSFRLTLTPGTRHQHRPLAPKRRRIRRLSPHVSSSGDGWILRAAGMIEAAKAPSSFWKKAGDATAGENLSQSNLRSEP